MKQSELKREFAKVERRLARSGLIGKCIEALKHNAPNYEPHEHADYCEAKGNYFNPDTQLSIDYWASRGNMGLRVNYQHQPVLVAEGAEDTTELVPHVGRIRIQTYKPGEWEKIVRDLANPKPKKPKKEKPIDPEIDAKTLEEYRTRYSF